MWKNNLKKFQEKLNSFLNPEKQQMSALQSHCMMRPVTEHQTPMIFIQLLVTYRGTREIFRSMLQPQFRPSVPKQDSMFLPSQTVDRNAQVTHFLQKESLIPFLLSCLNCVLTLLQNFHFDKVNQKSLSQPENYRIPPHAWAIFCWCNLGKQCAKQSGQCIPALF